MGGATCRTPPIPRSAFEKDPKPGPNFEGNPVGEGTTRRGTDTPVHHPERPAGSTHSSARGLSPPEQLERQAGFPSSDKTRPDSPVPTLHSSTLVWRIPWTEEPGRLQSMGSLESDKTERLPFHFSLSCIGEGTGNPLQCSCLENPRDGEAWWAAIYGVAQSRTRLSQTQLTLHLHKVEMTNGINDCHS